LNSGQQRHVSAADTLHCGLRGHTVQKGAHLIVGNEARQRSAKPPQSRTMASDELLMATNEDTNVPEDDDSYNPCGEAVHLKNAL